MLLIKGGALLLGRQFKHCQANGMRMVFGSSVDNVYKTCGRLYEAFQVGMSHFYSTSTSNVSSSLEPSKPQRPFTVAVEGNIGSGKTALLRHFASERNVEVIAEPVDKWRDVNGQNALALMYSDPSRWALTFQTYVQLTMLQTHIAPTPKPVKLMERSIYSAKYCFVENLKNSGKMPDMEHTVLTKWFDWIITNQDCSLDLIVYLRTQPETAAERIRLRGRREEKPVPLDYLRSLHELHEDWLVRQTKHSLPCPVLVLEADIDKSEMLEVYTQHEKQILGGKL